MLKWVIRNKDTTGYYCKPEKKRQFSIAIYCYTDSLKDERNDMMHTILESDDMEGMKGTLVIAINVDRQHYPYSSLAFRNAPELFGNSLFKNKRLSIK